MKVSLPYYLIGLLAAFVFASVKHYVPDLPLTQEQVVYVIVLILAALNVDLVNGLRAKGIL